MPFRHDRLLIALVLALGLGGCSLVSPDRSIAEVKASAPQRASFRVALPPDQACAKAARMLMWCAGGFSYHYRCNTESGGARSELSGILEEIVRSEYFLAAEFRKVSGGSEVVVHQHEGWLLDDYAAMMEKYFTNPDCQPR
jgi:hypothetical protein